MYCRQVTPELEGHFTIHQHIVLRTAQVPRLLCEIVQSVRSIGRNGRGLRYACERNPLWDWGDFHGGQLRGFWLASGAMAAHDMAFPLLSELMQKAWNTQSVFVLSGVEHHRPRWAHG